MGTRLWIVEPPGRIPADTGASDVVFSLDPTWEGPSGTAAPCILDPISLSPAEEDRINRTGMEGADRAIEALGETFPDAARLGAPEALRRAAIKGMVWRGWILALLRRVLETVRPESVVLLGHDGPAASLVARRPERLVLPTLERLAPRTGVRTEFRPLPSPSPDRRGGVRAWLRRRAVAAAGWLASGGGGGEGRPVLLSGGWGMIEPLLDPLRERGFPLRFHEEPMPFRVAREAARRGVRPLRLLPPRSVPAGPDATASFLDRARRRFADLPDGEDLFETSRDRLAYLASVELPRAVARIRRYAAFFAREPAACVVVSEDAAEVRRPLCLAARAVGVPTVGLWHGIPGVFGVHLGMPVTDRIAAYGTYGIERYVAERRDDPSWYAVTGAPRYDEMVARRARRTEDRTGLRARFGWRDDDRVALLTTHPVTTPWRPGFLGVNRSPADHVRLVEATARAVASVPGLRLLVKLHPRDDRPELTERGLGFLPPDRRRIVAGGSLSETLNAADVLVTTFSTTAVEGMLMDLPVVTVQLEAGPFLHPYADDGTALPARSAGEIAEALRGILDNPSVRERLAEARGRHLSRYCVGAEEGGGAAGRVADLVAETARGRDSG